MVLIGVLSEPLSRCTNFKAYLTCDPARDDVLCFNVRPRIDFLREGFETVCALVFISKVGAQFYNFRLDQGIQFGKIYKRIVSLEKNQETKLILSVIIT